MRQIIQEEKVSKLWKKPGIYISKVGRYLWRVEIFGGGREGADVCGNSEAGT